MSVEQAARDFFTVTNDPEQMRVYVTADAVVDGGPLPYAIPVMEWFKMGNVLATAFSDFKIRHYWEKD